MDVILCMDHDHAGVAGQVGADLMQNSVAHAGIIPNIVRTSKRQTLTNSRHFPPWISTLDTGLYRLSLAQTRKPMRHGFVSRALTRMWPVGSHWMREPRARHLALPAARRGGSG